MKQIILRVDDIHAYTTPHELEWIYGACWQANIPVCFAVIPYSAYTFSETELHATLSEPADIRQNPALVSFLQKRQRENLVELMLHGYQHHYGELADGDVDDIRQTMVMGYKIMQETFPDQPIKILVPPHDYLSQHGLMIADELGLGVCSTWAAIHGNTRLAHWQSQIRQWRGKYTGSPQQGRYATDTKLLDFEGDSAKDWHDTQHLLNQSTDHPVIFVQHYWQLIGQGSNATERFARWRRWLEQMKAQPNVEFCRFTDVLGNHHDT